MGPLTALVGSSRQLTRESSWWAAAYNPTTISGSSTLNGFLRDTASYAVVIARMTTSSNQPGPPAIPAMKPPLGVVPNFDNPPNHDTATKVILSICTAVTTILIAIRLYVKIRLIKIYNIEDCKGCCSSSKGDTANKNRSFRTLMGQSIHTSTACTPLAVYHS
jgi:hypothetical protein